MFGTPSSPYIGQMYPAGAPLWSWNGVSWVTLTGSSLYTPLSHVGSGGASHALATTTVAGFMSPADKTKLDGVSDGATNYSHPDHTGDVTSSSDGATTIVDGVVTNAKLASVATATLKGRSSAGTGAPEDLTPPQVRSLLGLAALAVSGSASDLSGGAIPASVFDDVSHGIRSGGSSHALATTSLAGFLSPADKTKLDGLTQTFHVDAYGALGGSADDGPAFQAALDAASAAGANVVYFTRNHRILSNVTVPRYCSLVGPLGLPGQQQDGGSGGDYDVGNGILKISSAHTITLRHGSRIEGAILIRDGLDLPFSSVATAQAGLAAFAGTALTINGDDTICRNLLILGFNLGILSINRGRMRFENVQGDCNNGIEIATCLDVTYLTNCHFWPFTTANYSWTASDTTQGILMRPGIAFHMRDTVDWPKLKNCFSYGYMRGFRIHNSSSFYMDGCAADGPVNAGAPLQAGSIGILVEGVVVDAVINGAYMAGKDQAYHLNTTGVSYLMLTDTQAVACTIAWYFPGTGAADVSGGLARSCTHGLYLASASYRVDADGVRMRQITGFEFVATVSTAQFFCRNMDYLTKSGGASAVNSATNWNVPNIASAATLVLPNDYGDTFIVVNSVTITSILGGYTSRRVTLIFQNGLTVQNGGNIRLHNSANFVGAANSSLSLVWDQTRWIEVGRCV